MRSLIRVILFLTLVAGLPHHLVQATQGVSNYTMNDPLLWAPLVFRGEIIDLKEELSTYDKWGIVRGGRKDVVVERMVIRVDEVIKGVWVDANIEVAAFRHLHGTKPAPYAVGNGVVLAIYYNASAARFQLRNYLGLFVQNGENWVRPDGKTYRIPIQSPSMTLPEIIGRANSLSPEIVASQAEMVIVGSVTGVEPSARQADGSELTCWTLQISEVLKGDSSGDVVTFCMPTRGNFPEWAVPVPRNLRQGEDWLVFLRRRAGGWIPFAGVNGMLRVQGDSVLYDGVVDIGIPWSELKATVRASHE